MLGEVTLSSHPIILGAWPPRKFWTLEVIPRGEALEAFSLINVGPEEVTNGAGIGPDCFPEKTVWIHAVAPPTMARRLRPQRVESGRRFSGNRSSS